MTLWSRNHCFICFCANQSDYKCTEEATTRHKGNGGGYRLLLSDMRKWGLLRESWTEELQPSCTTSICCFMWGETGWMVHEHISWYFVHTLETPQTFLQQHVRMCHPGGAALPVQPDRAAGTSRSCYQQWQGHKWKPKVIRRDDGRRNGLLPPPAKQFSFLVLATVHQGRGNEFTLVNIS